MFLNMHLCGVHDGETEATVRLFGGAVWVQTSGHVNNRFPILIREVPLHDLRLVCGAFQGKQD
jgi:hypothetical protein